MLLGAALTGCANSNKGMTERVTVADLQAKVGVSPAEWQSMMQPLADEKMLSLVPTSVEFLEPGLIIVFISEGESAWPAGELRFQRKAGKWERQIGVLSEHHRKRGRFIAIAEFEEILAQNEEEIRRRADATGQEWELDFVFENYVAPRRRTDAPKFGHSRLPSVRGWRFIADQLSYTQDVFLIHSSRETVVAIELDGAYRYLVRGAVDFTEVFPPRGLIKRTPNESAEADG